MAVFVDFIGWPTGADIFIDDAFIGLLPLYNYMLKWGKYQVRAEKEGYITEHRKDFVAWPAERKKTIVFQLKKLEAE